MNRSLVFSGALLALGILLAASGLYFRRLATVAQREFDRTVAPYREAIRSDLRAAETYRDAVQDLVIRGKSTVNTGVSPRGFFPAENLLRVDPPTESPCRNVPELRVATQSVAFQGPVDTLSRALTDCRAAGFRTVSLSIDPAPNGTVRAELTFRFFRSSDFRSDTP